MALRTSQIYPPRGSRGIDDYFLDGMGYAASVASLVDGLRSATTIILEEAGRLAGPRQTSTPQEEDLLRRVRLAIVRLETEGMQRLADETEPRRPSASRTALEQKALDLVMNGTEWLSAAEVGNRFNPETSNPHAAVSRWLSQGHVFAIDHRGKKMYPAYAFNETWKPIAELKSVISALAGYSPYRLASWFESVNASLRGKRPRELLKINPAAVVRAAEKQTVGAVHG